MIKGLVSIITPAYNCGDYIGETIRSIQDQTYSRWELIIVDDCSTDQTEEIVRGYAREDERIRYLRLAVNSGAAIARTESMKLAEGEYMAFCDSDDLWTPEKLEKQLLFMQETGHAFTCTAYEQIDEAGSRLGKIIRPRPTCDYKRLLLDCPVGNSTVMYDVGALGKFEVPNIRKRNDDALWLAMLKRTRYIWGLPDVLTRYRVRAGSISSNKLELVKYHWKLYRDIEHLSVASSVFHVCYWGIIKVFRIK